MANVDLAEIDPVCGMKVQPQEATPSFEHGGRTWYFCCAGCRTKFEAAPARYDGSQPAVLVSLGSIKKASAPGSYTCPMHPEGLSPKPGACPKCGMALEAVEPSAPVERTEYTCPMHPQIVRDGPGACPICGMALDPRTVTTGAANPELASMTRRMWVGAVLTFPLLAIMLSDLLPSRPLQGGLMGWIEFALAT